MKTAISVPNEIFENASRAAAALGMTRSAFFARAVERYLQQLEAESITLEIDAALANVSEDDSGSAAVAVGRRRLARGTQAW
jgi:predicted DNA-binding protein